MFKTVTLQPITVLNTSIGISLSNCPNIILNVMKSGIFLTSKAEDSDPLGRHAVCCGR
jgi:hypothetical protein